MPPGDEREGLANQFNDMGARLQESYADLENKVASRAAKPSETLEQQTATSEVLRVISSWAGDLEPAFEAVLANARLGAGDATAMPAFAALTGLHADDALAGFSPSKIAQRRQGRAHTIGIGARFTPLRVSEADRGTKKLKVRIRLSWWRLPGAAAHVPSSTRRISTFPVAAARRREGRQPRPECNLRTLRPATR